MKNPLKALARIGIVTIFSFLMYSNPAKATDDPSQVLRPDELVKNPYKWKGQTGVLNTSQVAVLVGLPRTMAYIYTPRGPMTFRKMIDEHTAIYEVIASDLDLQGELAVILKDSSPPDLGRQWRVFVQGPMPAVNSFGQPITVTAIRFLGYYEPPPPPPPVIALPPPPVETAPEPPTIGAARIPAPSGRWKTFTRNDNLSLEYPDNWYAHEEPNWTIVYPKNGFVKSKTIPSMNLTYGLIIGEHLDLWWGARGPKPNFAISAKQLITNFEKGDGSALNDFEMGHRHKGAATPVTNITVDNQPGESVEFTSQGPSERERNWMVMYPIGLNGAQIRFLVFTAREKDFETLRPTFEHMLQTLRGGTD